MASSMNYSKVFKTGHSLAIYINKEQAEMMNWNKGDWIKLEARDGMLVAEKVEQSEEKEA